MSSSGNEAFYTWAKQVVEAGALAIALDLGNFTATFRAVYDQEELDNPIPTTWYLPAEQVLKDIAEEEYWNKIDQRVANKEKSNE